MNARHTPSGRESGDATDTLLERFEQAWQSGATPRIEEFVRPRAAGTPVNALRLELLLELIKIDLDYRWRRRDPVQPRLRVEDFLQSWPELNESKQVVLELIREEYLARSSWGGVPPRAEYAGRFPQYKVELEQVLGPVDTEVAAEFQTPRLAAPRSEPELSPSARAGKRIDTALPASSVELGDLLRRNRLLSEAQLDELSRTLIRRFPEPRILAKELIRRGWLTPYQVNQILQGRGPELILGPYVVLERLGEGGAGQVFKARHQKMDRVVALKVIRKDLLTDAEVVARFSREVQILSQLDHPHIVHAYDAGPTGATYFLAMEYVEGTDLGRLVKQGGPLPVLQACAYIRQAALGLQHAHERGLVHRDIKPHNLIMSLREGVIKVADLGLARFPRSVNGDATAALAGNQTTGTLTPQNAVLMGTADYLAPEQALDFHQADIRADIYSLGCTFYFLLTGQPPFPGGSLAQKLVKHMQAEPPAVRKARPDLPAKLVPVLGKMLAKRPEQRYQTPAEVAEALAPWVGADALAADGHKAPPAGKRRHRLAGMAVGGLLAAAAALGLVFLLQSSPRRDATPAGTAQSSLDLLDAKRIPPGKLPQPAVEGLVAILGEPAPGPAEVHTLAWSKDDKLLAFSGRDGFVQVWSMTGGKPRLVGKSAAAIAVTSLAFRPDTMTLACGAQDKLIRWWDITEAAMIERPFWNEHSSSVSAVAFAPDGRIMASASGDETFVQLWDMQAATPKKLARLPVDTVHALAFAPDGKTIVTGDDHQRVWLWDGSGAEWKMRAPGMGHGSSVRKVAIVPPLVAASNLSADVFVWDTSSPAPKQLANLHPGGGIGWSIAFAPAGKVMAVGDAKGVLVLYDPFTGKEMKRWQLPQQPTDLLFSADGRHLAVLNLDGTVFILRLARK